MASTSSNQETSIQIVTSDTLPIKGKTMKLEDDQLTVQVENPVDFISLTHHDCNLTTYLKYQDLNGYLNILNGPIYENLVRYFEVRAEIYDQYAARLEEHEKVLIDPSFGGKT